MCLCVPQVTMPVVAFFIVAGEKPQRSLLPCKQTLTPANWSVVGSFLRMEADTSECETRDSVAITTNVTFRLIFRIRQDI